MGRGSLIVVGLLALVAGCGSEIDGTPAMAPDASSARHPGIDPADPASPTETVADPSESPLVTDVVDDECLLDKAGFAALLGRSVLEPEQLDIKRSDGSIASACYTHEAEGFPTPLGSINVFGVSTGSPEALTRRALSQPGDHHEVPGVGRAAMVVRDGDGASLLVATDRYVITIDALRTLPSDQAWATAGRAAVAALP